MSLGEILDRTFQIYRQRFWVFIGLSIFPAAGMTLLQFLNLFWWRIQVPELMDIAGVNFGYIVYYTGAYHCSLFLHALIWPPLVLAASQAYLGERPGIGSSLRRCSGRWGSWIGLSSMLQLLVVVLAEVAAIAAMIGLAALASWLSHDSETFMDPFMTIVMGLSIPGAYVFSLWLGTLYLGAVPAWNAEGLNVRKSFKRSRKLLKGSRWRLLCARLVPATIMLVLEVSASVALRFIAMYAARALHHPAWFYTRPYLSAYVVSAGAISALLGPLFPIALTLLYYDQRIRKEGFDIEWMMQSAGMTELVQEPAPADPMPASVPVEGQEA